MTLAQVYDDRPCELGEGPLWHPLRQELFWFDIPNRRMLARGAAGPRDWHFDEMHSAAGWIDRDHLLLASETGLWRFALETGTRDRLCALEADNPVTRSNDGRADPRGGFWIGTMGKQADPAAGAIWRWYQGELRQLFGGITISNAICFTPCGQGAYFTDTVTGQVMTVTLDADGWPSGAPSVFVDLKPAGLNPDGAVVAADGTLWVAQWGASRVAGYGPDGQFGRALSIPAPHASCPAFGGADLDRMFVTSARQDMDAQALSAWPLAGQTFVLEAGTRGQAEHRVRL